MLLKCLVGISSALIRLFGDAICYRRCKARRRSEARHDRLKRLTCEDPEERLREDGPTTPQRLFLNAMICAIATLRVSAWTPWCPVLREGWGCIPGEDGGALTS